MPYVHIDIPGAFAVGQTVDAKIDKAPVRVTRVSEKLLRIEPDELCWIHALVSKDNQTTIRVYRDGGVND